VKTMAIKVTPCGDSIASSIEIEYVFRQRENADAALALALDCWTQLNERYLSLVASGARRERAS
jgi:hypothetical protein